MKKRVFWNRYPRVSTVALATLLVVGVAACGGDEPAGEGGPGSGARSAGTSGAGRPGGGGAGGPGEGGPGRGGERPTAAVPVETASALRRSISSYIETNGTLEAENEVDLMARTSGPIVELKVEEGDLIRKGQLLARIDDEEIRARVAVSEVMLKEAQLAFERAKTLSESQLMSPEQFEQTRTRFETAKAQLEGERVLLRYTEIRAPFSGLIINRYINFAQQVNSSSQLFRISDFDPLLCPIQVPERDLPRLGVGQPAHLEFEAWPGERFTGRVLRIRPVVDAATGTVRVTLEVPSGNRLRPGMFARVYVETETREDTLVIPRAALSLESLGDTVYVIDGGVAKRRDLTLGFREGDSVEVLAGLSEGERIVVVGHEGLSDGTPIRVLSGGEEETVEATIEGGAPAGGPAGGAPTGKGPPDFSTMTPEDLERVKARMRERGLSDEQIEERIRNMRETQGG